MKTPKSPTAPVDRKTTVRFNADDNYYLDQLQRVTGITVRADQVRNCIRIAATQHGIPPPSAVPRKPK